MWRIDDISRKIAQDCSINVVSNANDYHIATDRLSDRYSGIDVIVIAEIREIRGFKNNE